MSTQNILAILALAGSLAACSAKAPGGAPATLAGAESSQPASTSAATPAAAAPGAALGERIYNGNCLACHQQSGIGIPGVYPSLSGSPVVLGDPAELALWVTKGIRPRSMPAGRYTTQMLQFGWMKPADAAALFTYLRSNFGNSATPVYADTVAKALGQ